MQLSGYFMQVVAMQITFREQRQHSKSPPSLAGGSVAIVILPKMPQPEKMQTCQCWQRVVNVCPSFVKYSFSAAATVGDLVG